LVSVDIDSYRGRHRFHGASQGFAQAHPWIYGITCSVLASYLVVFPARISDEFHGSSGTEAKGEPPEVKVISENEVITIPVGPEVGPDCRLEPARRGLPDNEVRIRIPTEQGPVDIVYSSR
jgi:hypothetical protein